MDVTFRTCRPDEVGTFVTVLSRAFGGEPSDLERSVERWSKLLEPDRMWAAFDGDSIVATAADFAFTMTIPGGEAPTAGVTLVGVLPTHRRRGVAAGLMRRQLDAVHAREEPFALLWASEGHIYPRFGYGMANLVAYLDMDPGHAAFRDPGGPVGRTRLLSREEALEVLPDLYEQLRVVTPGMVARTPDWWRWHTLLDQPQDRHGAGPMFHAVWEHAGQAQAYALYRVQQKWTDEGPASSLFAAEVLATTSLGRREIWRFLTGVDLVTRVKSWLVPADDPLLLMLQEPRRPQLRLHDGVWLRLVDLPEALRRRSYATTGSMTFEVTDRFCPWNDGTWALTAGVDDVVVERTAGAADLRLDIADLASAYLGGFSFADLRRADRVVELVDGAVERADALFRTAVSPYNPEIF